MTRSIPPGRVFGRYRIVRPLGSGGMGSVHEARHIELDRRVALKVLQSRLVLDKVALDRFVREGKTAAKIEHPHVVSISDVGTHEGIPYIVMEYLEGESLGSLLSRENRLASERAVDLLLPILSGVQAAHDHGIVHRDLKPENVFLVRTPHGAPHPKVLDFGISKIADADHSATSTGALLGTPHYVSPEQARNSKDVGPATDQYSLGVVLYECVTGERPFQSDSLFDLLRTIVDGEFVRPSGWVPELPLDLDRVITKAMAREAHERYASLAEFGRALLPFASPPVAATWTTAFGDDRPPIVVTSQAAPSVARAEGPMGALTVASERPRPAPSSDRIDAGRSPASRRSEMTSTDVPREEPNRGRGLVVTDAEPYVVEGKASVESGEERRSSWRRVALLRLGLGAAALLMTVGAAVWVWSEREGTSSAGNQATDLVQPTSGAAFGSLTGAPVSERPSAAPTDDASSASSIQSVESVAPSASSSAPAMAAPAASASSVKRPQNSTTAAAARGSAGATSVKTVLPAPPTSSSVTRRYDIE